MVAIFILLFLALITDIPKRTGGKISIIFLYLSFLVAIYYLYTDMTDILNIAL